MNFKKLLALILAMVLFISVLPMNALNLTVSAATSGKTGYCTWSLDGTVLTISGDGDMRNYDYSSSLPWGTDITKVIIENGVTSIGDYVFENCKSLTSITIPDSVTSIGSYAFRDCTSLTSITIPDSVISIGGFAFGNCTSLTSITIPDSVTSIGNSAFRDCTSLTSVTIPDSVTSIGNYAFCDCTSLTSVAIPDSVTSIGEYAFCDCTSLTSVAIPDSVTSIGKYAFCDCTSLTSVAIPDSVTSIGSSAFRDCTSLTSITIPESVTNIGYATFYNCQNLTSITIPDSVTSIGDSAFVNCTSLTKVNITDIEAWCNISFSTNNSNPLYYAENLYLNGKIVTNLIIPDSVTSIGNYAFCYCTSLTSITIPDSVTSIGRYTFRGCTSLENVYISDIEKWFAITLGDEYSNPMYYAENLYVNNKLLTDIKIKADTQIINGNLFYNCKTLENIFIPKSVILIKQNAFYNCSGIKNVYFEGTAEEWAEITILSGNDYLKNATVYFNSAGIPGGITSVKISKLPNKVKYIENEEELDLAGGILTVNYNGGATLDIDLATMEVKGFDNSILGKQTITVKYGDFTTEFEVEIIPRPISFIAVSAFPIIREYILGEKLDLTGGKLAVGYPDGNYAIFDLTADMVSNYNMNKLGYQTVIVTYKGHTTEFSVRVFKNGDIDGDDTINATDVTLLRTNLLENNANSKQFDINQDNTVDILDLVRLKKKLAGIIA